MKAAARRLLERAIASALYRALRDIKQGVEIKVNVLVRPLTSKKDVETKE